MTCFLASGQQISCVLGHGRLLPCPARGLVWLTLASLGLLNCSAACRRYFDGPFFACTPESSRECVSEKPWTDSRMRAQLSKRPTHFSRNYRDEARQIRIVSETSVLHWQHNQGIHTDSDTHTRAHTYLLPPRRLKRAMQASFSRSDLVLRRRAPTFRRTFFASTSAIPVAAAVFCGDARVRETRARNESRPYE